jgi:hypothetical protein
VDDTDFEALSQRARQQLGSLVALHTRGLLWVKTRMLLGYRYVSSRQLRTYRRADLRRCVPISDLSRCSRLSKLTRSPRRASRVAEMSSLSALAVLRLIASS